MSAVVNQEKCAGCGVCLEVCPVQAISLNLNKKAQINSEKCIECGRCARECPNQAIELVQEVAYPLVQRDLPQTIATEISFARKTISTSFARNADLVRTKTSETNAGESESQPGGTPMPVFQKPPAPLKTGVPARGRTVRPAANTIIPFQPRSNKFNDWAKLFGPEDTVTATTVDWPSDEVGSIVKFDVYRKKVFVCTGTVLDGNSLYKNFPDTSCRNKIVIKVDEPEVYHLFSSGNFRKDWGIHPVAFYGDLRKGIKDLAELTGFSVTG